MREKKTKKEREIQRKTEKDRERHEIKRKIEEAKKSSCMFKKKQIDAGDLRVIEENLHFGPNSCFEEVLLLSLRGKMSFQIHFPFFGLTRNMMRAKI